MVLNPEDETLGLRLMSLVERPAIMVNWVKFNEQSPIKFSIQDEEERIVFAPALIPDLPIVRHTPEGEKFYLVIDAKTIEQTAIKLSKDGISTLFDTNHDGKLLNDIVSFEYTITNEKRFPKAVGFEDLPLGTLFVTSKINNDDIWDKIKKGELNGYSIDGLFNFKEFTMLDNKEVDLIINNFFKQ